MALLNHFKGALKLSFVGRGSASSIDTVSQYETPFSPGQPAQFFDCPAERSVKIRSAASRRQGNLLRRSKPSPPVQQLDDAVIEAGHGDRVGRSQVRKEAVRGIDHEWELIARTPAGIEQQQDTIGGIRIFEILNLLKDAVLLDEKVSLCESGQGISARIENGNIQRDQRD